MNRLKARRPYTFDDFANDAHGVLYDIGRTYESAAQGAALGTLAGGKLGGTRGAGLGGVFGGAAGAYYGLSKEQAKKIQDRTTQFSQGYGQVASQTGHHAVQAESWWNSLFGPSESGHNEVLLKQHYEPEGEDPTR